MRERSSLHITDRSGRGTKRRLRVAGDTLIDGVTAVLRYLAAGGDPGVPRSYVETSSS